MTSQPHESSFECDCFIPALEGAGQHSPGCAVFCHPCESCGLPVGGDPGEFPFCARCLAARLHLMGA